MSPREVLVQLEARVDRIKVLCRSKGVEYANSAQDDLANFKRLSEQVGVSPEVVLWVLLEKHLDALRFTIRHHQGITLSEATEGRIDDAILYLHLLDCLMRERK